MKAFRRSCVARITSALSFISKVMRRLSTHLWPRYTAVPVDHCYWVVPGMFLAESRSAGALPVEANRRLNDLFNAGVRHIVTLVEDTGVRRTGPIEAQEEMNRHIYETVLNLTCSRWPVRSSGIPVRGRMVAILNEIDTSIALGKPVYIHCQTGQELTDIVVGCYLARHAFASEERVFDLIEGLRECRREKTNTRPFRSEHSEMVLSWSIGE